MQLMWRDVTIGTTVINTSLTQAETAELQRLAAGKDVLEVGSAYGYSTVALALVAKAVDAVDPHLTHGSHRHLVANLAGNGLRDKVRIHVGMSQEVLPRLYGQGRRFDLVWIDGDHTAPVVAHDVQWALELLRPGGIIACHDHGEVTCPGVAVALDAWRPYDYKVDTLAVYGRMP